MNLLAYVSTSDIAVFCVKYLPELGHFGVKIMAKKSGFRWGSMAILPCGQDAAEVHICRIVYWFGVYSCNLDRRRF